MLANQPLLYVYAREEPGLPHPFRIYFQFHLAKESSCVQGWTLLTDNPLQRCAEETRLTYEGADAIAFGCRTRTGGSLR
jgi:hypothetical protein